MEVIGKGVWGEVGGDAAMVWGCDHVGIVKKKRRLYKVLPFFRVGMIDSFALVYNCGALRC